MLSMSKIVTVYHKRGQRAKQSPRVSLNPLHVTYSRVQTLESNFPGWQISSIDSKPVKAQALIDIGECYGHCRGDNNE